MTRERADWLKYSNIVPILFLFITSIVGLTGFWFALDNRLALTNQKLDFIVKSINDGSSYAQENRTLILQEKEDRTNSDKLLESRIQRLEDTR